MLDPLKSLLHWLAQADPLRLAVAVLIMMILVWLAWQGRHREPPFRVRARALLTDNEIEFHERLCAAVPECQIMVQVSMGALIEPDVPGGSGNWLAIRGRFAQKVVDYVVIDEERRVLALIELDDATHDRRRDAERDAITALAGYTTLRYESRAKPDVDTLREELLSCSTPVKLPRRAKS